jgi:GNAT superfamily N-acetyltransferase
VPDVIRPARPDDMPQVVALIRALSEFERLPGPDDAAAARLAADAFAHPPRFEVAVAEVDGDVVGYALYFMVYSTFLARPSLYLEDLFVHPRARSRGLGRALLCRLAAEAQARGCGRFEWTVLDWNVRAQSFYERLGARVLGEWRVCRVDGAALEALARGG